MKRKLRVEILRLAVFQVRLEFPLGHGSVNCKEDRVTHLAGWAGPSKLSIFVDGNVNDEFCTGFTAVGRKLGLDDASHERADLLVGKRGEGLGTVVLRMESKAHQRLELYWIAV